MRRRISDLVHHEPPTPPGGPPTIIGPEDDDVIPGEIVVALEVDAAAELLSIPTMPLRGAAGADASALGESGPLAEALSDLGISSVARVYAPGPTEVVAGIAMADDLGLDTTLLVRFGADTSPVEA